MTLLDELHAKRDIILKIAEECGLTNVRVFGSVARGEETAESDIDMLVDYVPGSEKALEVFDFPTKLENIFHRRIDMVFESGLYHLMRPRVLNEATTV